MNNTAGSFSLLGAKVPRDATVAAKLRRAGAILLGKTNLSQWANYRSSNSSNGWSAYGGQTYGAYYPGQDPSGSSSGSGVSASLGLAFGTLGTETDGSIVSPSQMNNIVGIKPTVRVIHTRKKNCKLMNIRLASPAGLSSSQFLSTKTLLDPWHVQ
jgi:amidase